ncbi:transcriptional regulator [Natronococcus pandeyae]|uniref:Transcriptional regulator n=1 Tax=Natronococcus pandeyae TaxID=2055836 RepID=A0A8J8Q236_9EURY|nr:helix-turn-helix domain-containing protein [Natronococcus pandeyae]TYL37892.1 transcriptional regulator [Natronococcus pandeyae]
MASELVQRNRGHHVGSAGRTDGVNRARSDDPDVSPSELFDLLGDEHTRNVLHAVSERPRSGREVAEAASVSRPTAYRRLNRLEEIGFVTSQTILDPNGNHHKQFTAVLEGATLELDDELRVTIDLNSAERS